VVHFSSSLCSSCSLHLLRGRQPTGYWAVLARFCCFRIYAIYFHFFFVTLLRFLSSVLFIEELLLPSHSRW
jgi:hypothetical protein